MQALQDWYSRNISRKRLLLSLLLAGENLSRCLGLFSMSWTGGHCSHTKTTVLPTNLHILAQDSQTYHIN
jgi:hypothetical protein